MKTKAICSALALALLAPAAGFSQDAAAPAPPAPPAQAAPVQPEKSAAGVPSMAIQKEEGPVAKVGDAIPAGKFKDLATDKEVTAADLMGKGTFLVVVMQTACSQCRQEVAFVQKLSENKEMGEKFTPIAIVVDANPGERVAKFKADSKLTMAFYSDPDFNYPPQLGIDVTPAIFVVKDGKLAYKKTGFTGNAPQEIVNAVKKLL